MTFRKTESRLPTELGFKPEDLGQVGELVPLVLVNPVCYLISYLSSPLTQGSKNTYVVFVTDAALQQQVTSYKFEVTQVPPVATYIKNDTIGVFEYTPEYNGQIIVTVEILDNNGSTLRKLTLKQDVQASNAVIERLFTCSSIGFDSPDFEWRLDVGGSKGTTREMVNDLKPYIKAAFDSVTNDKKIPKMFLAAITYLQAFKVPKEKTTSLIPEIAFRDAELNDAANALNGDKTSFFFSNNKPHSLGVCQISPQTLAMIVKKLQPPLIEPKLLIDWTELPSEQDKRGKIRDQILEAYKGFSLETKIDLYNLLRFPKSNEVLSIGV